MQGEYTPTEVWVHKIYHNGNGKWDTFALWFGMLDILILCKHAKHKTDEKPCKSKAEAWLHMK